MTPIPILIVHRDSFDSTIYWCGLTNGHDGQGWTAERKEALEYSSFSEANLAKKAARRAHPTMRIELQADDGGEE